MITLLCVGKIKEQAMQTLIDDYAKRIQVFHKFMMIQLKEANPSFELEKRIAVESDDILRHISASDFVVLFDLKGKMMDSMQLANTVENWLANNQHLVLIIGGSDGVNEQVKARTNVKLAVSQQTFPHLLFRLMVLEQLYRCFKIIRHQVYHK